MNPRYQALYEAACEELPHGGDYGDARSSIAHAIAAAVEVGLRRAGFHEVDPADRPTEPRLAPRYMAVGDDYLPDSDAAPLSWGAPADEWDDRIEREL